MVLISAMEGWWIHWTRDVEDGAARHEEDLREDSWMQ